MSEELKFIASYDDTIQFCGTDEELGERFKTIFAEAQGRVVSFDPIYVAASNVENIADVDIWTKPKSEKKAKRGFGNFDASKFTKYFIETQKAHLQNPEESEALVRMGFDAYAYLMAHEEEILAMYGKREELTKLQMASLHYVEMRGEVVELDYLRYIATYDDLVLAAVSSKPIDKSWNEWLEVFGQVHYVNSGLNEIFTGLRPVIPFFDAVKYIATHAGGADSFKNEDGTINESAVAIAFITVGALHGLQRNGFQPNVFLANYPELLAEDIYINNEISTVKVAKLWLEHLKEGGVTLDKFDPVDFKEVMGLDELSDPFTSFVTSKLGEYRKMLKKQKSAWWKMTHACGTGQLKSLALLSQPVKLPKSKSKKEKKSELTPKNTLEEIVEE